MNKNQSRPSLLTACKISYDIMHQQFSSPQLCGESVKSVLSNANKYFAILNSSQLPGLKMEVHIQKLN
jgi:hypothetical protein